jgi:DNA-binding beta-propeller fold protein YncE
LYVGLLFSLVSCSGDDDSTVNTDLLVAFITDDAEGPGSVQRYNGTTGAPLGTFVSGGRLRGPVSMVFGPDGNLYVSSIDNGEVQRYNGTTGAFLNTVATAPFGTDPTFGFALGPLGLAFGPDGNLYVSNDFTNDVQRYNGTTGASLGTFVSAGLDVPTGLVFGPDGNLYVSSFNTNVVQRYSGRTGASMGIFAISNELSGPEQLVFGPDGDLYVASFTSNSVERFKGTTGEPMRTFVTPGSGGLNGPTGVAFGRDGNLYVSSNTSGEVLRYDGTTGAFINIFVAAGKQLFPAFLTFTP